MGTSAMAIDVRAYVERVWLENEGSLDSSSDQRPTNAYKGSICCRTGVQETTSYSLAAMIAMPASKLARTRPGFHQRIRRSLDKAHFSIIIDMTKRISLPAD